MVAKNLRLLLLVLREDHAALVADGVLHAAHDKALLELAVALLQVAGVLLRLELLELYVRGTFLLTHLTSSVSVETSP